jgi:hypothetical protein
MVRNGGGREEKMIGLKRMLVVVSHFLETRYSIRFPVGFSKVELSTTLFDPSSISQLRTCITPTQLRSLIFQISTTHLY